MFTNNYLNLVKGTFAGASSGGNSLAKITADVKLTNGQTFSAVYSTGTSTPSTIVTYTMDFLKVLFFSGTPFKYNATSSYMGCIHIALAQKESISPTDYTMSNGFYNYMTVSRSGEYLIVTVNNTTSSNLSFNTLQLGCVMHAMDNKTSNADETFILLAEIDLSQQTIAPGVSKTYRVKIDNPQ